MWFVVWLVLRGCCPQFLAQFHILPAQHTNDGQFIISYAEFIYSTLKHQMHKTETAAMKTIISYVCKLKILSNNKYVDQSRRILIHGIIRTLRIGHINILQCTDTNECTNTGRSGSKVKKMIILHVFIWPFTNHCINSKQITETSVYSPLFTSFL